eukprot:SAG11_NODE_14411_length_613_cov_0.747082_1_plen_55_part_10
MPVPYSLLTVLYCSDRFLDRQNLSTEGMLFSISTAHLGAKFSRTTLARSRAAPAW